MEWIRAPVGTELWGSWGNDCWWIVVGQDGPKQWWRASYHSQYSEETGFDHILKDNDNPVKQVKDTMDVTKDSPPDDNEEWPGYRIVSCGGEMEWIRAPTGTELWCTWGNDCWWTVAGQDGPKQWWRARCHPQYSEETGFDHILCRS
jgi:hypothetical protein